MSVFGTLFRVSTFGESHGVGVGCVIDGVPPGLKLTAEDIQPQLTRRRPGQSSLSTPRQEFDCVQIISGVENEVTLGTPICLLVWNKDQRQFDYANTVDVPRPGHADYTYQIKYGVKASSGGGRASARETIARVAAGAVAEKWLAEKFGTRVMSWVSSAGSVALPDDIARHLERNPPSRGQIDTIGTLKQLKNGNFVDINGVHYCGETGERLASQPSSIVMQGDIKEADVATRCPHPPTAARIAAMIQGLRKVGDSTGGVVTTVIRGVPGGIGEPCFDKLEADLAKGMMSLPATKGFEIGEGFKGVSMLGSEHNDRFGGRVSSDNPLLYTLSNHAGGTLGGISSGQDIVFRVAIKAVSSISISQETSDFAGNPCTLDVKGRHDPCVLPRAPPLLEAMAALVVIDHTMRQQARLGTRPLYTVPIEILSTGNLTIAVDENGETAAKSIN